MISSVWVRPDQSSPTRSALFCVPFRSFVIVAFGALNTSMKLNMNSDWSNGRPTRSLSCISISAIFNCCPPTFHNRVLSLQVVMDWSAPRSNALSIETNKQKPRAGSAQMGPLAGPRGAGLERRGAGGSGRRGAGSVIAASKAKRELLIIPGRCHRHRDSGAECS